MGEAKRRKQLLGSGYGKPLGLSSAKRIELIDSDIAQWISQHLDKCEYYNYLEKPFALQTRANSLSESNLEQVIENVAKHFSVTFDRTLVGALIGPLVGAILENRPIVFEELLFQSVNRAMIGILTIVATLPWSMHLELVNRSS